MGRPFFEYRTDEADAIHAPLQRAGLQYEEDWPGYRAEIEGRMREALAIEERNLPGHCPMLRKLRSSSRPSPRPSRSRLDGIKHYRMNCSSRSTPRWKRFSYKTRCSLSLPASAQPW